MATNFNAFVDTSPRNGNKTIRYRDGKTRLANGRWKVFTFKTIDKNTRQIIDGKERTASWIADHLAKELKRKDLLNAMGECDPSILVEDEIKNFILDCEKRNLEDATVQSFKRVLTAWRVNSKIVILSDISYDKLIDWRNGIPGSSSTVGWKLRLVKTFIFWLKETDKIQALPFKKKMAPEQKDASPKYYTIEQWMALCKALARVCPITELACYLAYSAGLRAGELCGNRTRTRAGILYEDLTWNADGTVDLELRKEIVKGRKRGRTLRLDAGVVALLGSRKSGPIIPISYARLWERFKSARLLAGLDKVTPTLTIHGLRHSFAKNYLKFGNKDLDALRKQLGHARITTTQIYSGHEKSDLDAGIELSYRARKKEEAILCRADSGVVAGQIYDISSRTTEHGSTGLNGTERLNAPMLSTVNRGD